MHPWFKWISYIDPVTYAYGALVGDSLSPAELQCVEPSYVPYGPGYTDDSYRSCTLAGSTSGSSVVSGNAYLRADHGSVTQHVWRNAGLVIAFWVFFSIMAALGFEVNLQGGAGSMVLYDRRATERELAAVQDIEKTGHVESHKDFPPEKRNVSEFTDSEGDASMNAGQTIFTFRDISYFVHHMGHEKQLLHDVSGFVKPGKLVALMGSSGAGKTTLMDVLSQRKDSGRLEGHIRVNGQPQGISFQRETGYCEQNDVHEPRSTVREALIFSARLRQNHDVPDEEKIAYVEHIMDLLELTPLQHAIVGSKFDITIPSSLHQAAMTDAHLIISTWLWALY